MSQRFRRLNRISRKNIGTFFKDTDQFDKFCDRFNIMIGRLKDKMETSVIPPNKPFFAKVKKLKAVLILNRVYSGIDVKKSSPKAAHFECGGRRDTN